MARRHTLLAKSRLLEYSEIQASQIPAGTTVYEVSTLPSTVDETKVFIYVTSLEKYYRIKPKEPAQYDSSTADSGIMMGEPAVNMASGYEALFLHRYTSSGSGTQNDGLSVYKPITESVELNSSSMYTPTAQAVSDFVVPKLDSTTYTTSTPTVTLHENTIYRCTNDGVTSMTINISDMVTGPKTRESVVYFHTGNNPSPIAITGGNASTVVFGDTDLMENQDYWISVKDNTVTITTNLSDVAISGNYNDLIDKPDIPDIKIYRNLRGTAAVTTSPYYCTRWDVTDDSVTAYRDGMGVCVKVPTNGLGDGTYGTGFQINSLGYKPVVYNVNSKISTRYAVGSVIWAVYNSTQYGILYLGNGSQVIIGCWQVMDNEDLDCIKYASAIINRNTFANKKLYINTIDNAFAIADQKYWVIVTTHLKEIDGVTYPYADPNKTVLDDDYWVDSPVVAQASRPGVLFDGSYESNITVNAGYYMKVHIQFGPFTNNWTPSTTGYIFNGYPYGNYYLSFYDKRTPGQLSKLRIYNKYSTSKGWNLINATPFAGDINSNSYIEKMVNTGLYQCSCMEFIIYSKDSEYTNLCQIDYGLTRGNITHISSVNKFSDQELYKNFTWYKHNDNSENESTVSIEATSGLITSKDIKATNLTASKFVKTDSNKKLVSGDISASDVSDLSTVATSGSYNDLLNKPDLDATLYESLTYSQLTTKIDNSQLIKGRIYRITDFVTTTNTGNNPDINYYSYKSAMHPFDLLVIATSESNINANAKAVLHEGDTYFEYCDLDRWQIWYSVENQKCRWGDNDGKGVIYRMIDEWGNDCPYDFKNIMFKRMMTNNELDETNGTLTWVYTFDSGYDSDNSKGDCVVYNNRIGNYIFDDDGGPGIYLNDIVFLGFSYNNVFGKDCHSMTLHRACHDNKFGDKVSSVVARNNTYDNIIGNNCEYITINNGSYSNTIKDGCVHIRFGDASNDGGSLCRYNVVEDGNGYINIYNTDNSNDYLQNIYIAPGVNTETNLNISTITRGRNYRTTVGRDSNGNIRIYNEDDQPVQPDYTQTDENAPDYIKNKPDLNATLYESITYSQLKSKADNSQLVKGKNYRITDYNTVVNLTNVSSAGHAFDLVVTAISTNKLSHRASALLHDGDTYFSNGGAYLEKWQVWYDVNNNRDKYAWANTTTGKGVIYRLIDEYGNDCPYDFKNILFTKENVYTNVYTFNKFAEGYTDNSDLSLSSPYCYNNIIGPKFTVRKATLNNIVFLNTSNTSYCFNNTFGNDCVNNTFGNGCYGNTFGVSFNDNTTGLGFVYNTVGNNCVNNVFQDNFRYGTLGNSCSNNNFYGNMNSVIVENFNTYIELRGVGGSTLRNVYIAQGCSGTSETHTNVSITRGLSYRTTVARDSNGNIRIYNEDDTALPTVTSEDNGKILMVSDGAWSAQTVPVSDNVLY